MSSLNKASLIGNLGKDPEIRRTQDGRPIASFSIATSEKWKDKSGEKQEKTEWHNIVVFSEGLCKVIESYVKKGSKIYIEGQLKTRKWQDKEGHDRYTTEIVLDNFNSKLIMLDGRNQSSGGYANDDYATDNVQSTNVQSTAEVPVDLDDDIPF